MIGSFPGVCDFSTKASSLITRRSLPAAQTWLKSPLLLVDPRGQRRARKQACRALSVLVASSIWAAPLPLMAAGDWEFDIAPGEWGIAQLEQPRNGYLEQEKFAVGYSRTELFVQPAARQRRRFVSAPS